MKIYRVQDNEGRGPFKPGFSSKWVEERKDLANLPPWINELPIALNFVVIGAHYGCGCRTIEQLRRWFTPTEYKKLFYWGYHAVALDVDRILVESPVQLVFERATPLNKNTELIELYQP